MATGVRRWSRLRTACPANVFSFVRENDQDKVFAVFNFSGNPVTVSFSGDLHHDVYREFLSGAQVTLDEDSQLELAPWSNRVYVKEKNE